MVRKYQEQNVYEALMDRFKLLFEEFDNIYISFPEERTAVSF